MECNCEMWKENYPKLEAVTSSAYIHGVKYSGSVFKFCPWCGKGNETIQQSPAIKFLRVLLFQEEGYDSWVAQCLEHDIATQGKSKQEALDRLERTILGQIHLDKKYGIEPLSEIEPPPPNFLTLQPIPAESTYTFPVCIKCGGTVSSHPLPNCTMAESTLT